MSRFHQHLREDLRDPEFADAFYDMSVDIALLQVLEQARKALNVSEKELAERMGVQRYTVTRLFNRKRQGVPCLQARGGIAACIARLLLPFLYICATICM